MTGGREDESRPNPTREPDPHYQRIERDSERSEEPTPVLFGKDRFLKTLSLWNDHDPGRIINNVQVALDNHRGTQPLRDDMTLVAFRLN